MPTLPVHVVAAPDVGVESREKRPARSRCFRVRMRSRSWAAFSNSNFLAASRIWDSSWLRSSASWASLFTLAAAASNATSSTRDGDVVGFDDSGEFHVHGLDDGFGRDVVFLVVGELFVAAAIGFADGLVHGAGAAVGVENGAAGDVAGAAADGLDERGGAAEIAFFVGVEDGDERDFGEVEAFAETG